jgi:D-alanyl-D-alanine carboxypeptidase
MIKSKLIWSGIFVFLLTGIAVSCNKGNPTDQNSNEKKVQAAIDKVRQNVSDTLKISFPSLSILIQTPKEKIFVSSKGEGAQVVTADTYYRIASNTKNFTASAIMNMWEDGWLDYKAKITDFIPGTKTTYTPGDADWDFPFKNDITIKLLLQHAAGVYDVDNSEVKGYNGMTYTEAVLKADPSHQFSTGEMVKVLTQNDLYYFKPGGGYHYSNTGYSILAEIIKRVYTVKSGQVKTYADYMYDFITGQATPVPLPKFRFPILATDIAMPDPHLTSTILNPTGPVVYDKFNMSAQVGEGNGYTTMNELNTYIRTQMKGVNILKPATVELMQKTTSNANPDYGLGTGFTKNIGYGHNGARLGFLNLMAYDPKYDVSVIVMIPLYDFREDEKSFMTCFNALQNAAYAAREVLGYPGKP